MTDIEFPMRIAADVTVSADIIDSLLWDCRPGTNYWNDGIEHPVFVDGQLASFEIEVNAEDAEDEHGEQINGRRYTIDGHTWLKGMQRVLDEGEYGFSAGIPSLNPDDWDFDADDHDVIIQTALFGKVIYG